MAARHVMGSAKLSMHSSGKWRWAMTSEEAARRQLTAGQDRVITRWEQPAPVAPGWVRAATICVPSSSLRSLAPEKSPKKGVISFWSPGPRSREVWFDVFIKSPDAPALTFNNITELVGRIDLPSGGAIWVIGTEWEVTPERETIICELRQRSRNWHVEREGIESFNQLEYPTGTAWGRDDDDGRPIAIDLGDIRSCLIP